MPNKDTHLGIALLIFCVCFVALHQFNSLKYIFYVFPVFLGAVFPDILDPWSRENRFEHRRFWHSTNLLKSLSVMCLVSVGLSILYPVLFFVVFFLAGYLSHLLADSIKTQSLSKGLPTYGFVSGRFMKMSHYQI